MLTVGHGAWAAAPADRVALAIRHAYPEAADLVGITVPETEAALRRYYAMTDYRPLWFGDQGVRPEARLLVEALRTADREGIDPRGLEGGELAARLAAVDVEDPSAVAGLDQDITLSLVRYGALLRGRTPLPKGVNPSALAVTGGLPIPQAFDGVALLKSAAVATDFKAFLESLPPRQPEYRRLRQALATHRTLADKGGWPIVPEGPKMVLGVEDPRVQILRRRLRATGEMPHSAEDRSTRYDGAVQKAVRVFQRRHGLNVDGTVGASTLAALNVPIADRIRQILINMERWRRMPEDLGSRHILVNIAGSEMEVVEDGAIALSMRVIVGQTQRQTPVFSSALTDLVLNPVWHVPRHLAVADILPRLQRDPSYFARQGMRLYAKRGERLVEVDPTGIAWDRLGVSNFPYRLRQAPGPHNAMGQVKFLLPNPYDVYLHDTPSRDLFRKDSRSASSGCIRLEKPRELALLALKDQPDWTREKVDSLIDKGKTEVFHLKNPLPIHLVYRTAWSDDGGVTHFRPDIYQWDEALSKTLFGNS
ncbi:MAG: murein L,D-transpeptidase [Alphaproteobacteria bacterium]